MLPSLPLMTAMFMTSPNVHVEILSISHHSARGWGEQTWTSFSHQYIFDNGTNLFRRSQGTLALNLIYQGKVPLLATATKMEALELDRTIRWANVQIMNHPTLAKWMVARARYDHDAESIDQFELHRSCSAALDQYCDICYVLLTHCEAVTSASFLSQKFSLECGWTEMMNHILYLLSFMSQTRENSGQKIGEFSQILQFCKATFYYVYLYKIDYVICAIFSCTFRKCVIFPTIVVRIQTSMTLALRSEFKWCNVHVGDNAARLIYACSYMGGSLEELLELLTPT